MHDAIESYFSTAVIKMLNILVEDANQLLQIKINDFNINDIIDYIDISKAIQEVSRPTKESYNNKKPDNRKPDISAIEELFEKWLFIL